MRALAIAQIGRPASGTGAGCPLVLGLSSRYAQKRNRSPPRVKNLSPSVTFILGGAASGKSKFAENLCFKSAKSKSYIATSQVFDDEMKAKVAAHLRQRGTDWTTYEEPLEAATLLHQLPGDHICLLDCATMWLTNHLLAEHDLAAAQAKLLDAIKACPAELVIVSNEVGLGIVPENALARRFREAQGRLNIALAASADTVVQVTAGLPLVLKGQL
ncbi:bifunctional adenosylcobinamide kinase/adenosylcobinamide-phosphate guanylyltransferase [Pseudophaeobacter arcticus]|uniref:bifunctional adenosylcobinamide kinase/adenosylcobinamide-phosphate guanylyltransferase n=1 Tax=Pseudophaeobacter arcticus TaxID=385492 RepID=UPI00361828CF